MLNELLPTKLISELTLRNLYRKVEEIRISVGLRIRVTYRGVTEKLYVAKQEDVDFVVNKAVRNSMYAMSDKIAKGYLTYLGGIRIGLCGEAVYDNGVVQTIKNLNSLVIRIPHNEYGIADDVIDRIKVGSHVKNTLIVAPPFSGKTTMLRELARVLSVDEKVVVIDEKNEISATEKGVAYLDVGESMVLVGINRFDGVECAVRNLSPDIIVTDEVYGDRDRECIERCTAMGVSVLTSMHSNFKKDSMRECFECVITLSNDPPGRVVSIEEV